MKKRLTALLLALTMPLSGISAFAKEQPQNAEKFPEGTRYIPIQSEVPFTGELQETPVLAESEPIKHTETIPNPPDWLLEEFENEESGLLIEGIDGVVPNDEVATYATSNTIKDQWQQIFTSGLGETFTARMKEKRDGLKVTENTNRLIIEETDLSLPGKNGLDLTIKRRYDNQDTNYLTNQYRVSSSYEYVNNYYYCYSFTDNRNQQVYIAFPTVDDYYRLMSDGIDISAYPKQYSVSRNDETIYFYYYDDIYAKKVNSSAAVYHLTSNESAGHFRIYFRQEVLYLLDSRLIFTDATSLGNNWRWIFPQGTLIAYERYYDTSNRSQECDSWYTCLFQDIDGNVYSFDGYDSFTQTKPQTSGGEYTYQYDSSYNSVKNDYMTYERSFATLKVPGTEIDYDFKISDNRGLTYYMLSRNFSKISAPAKTQYLYPAAIEDRYGNMIRFEIDENFQITKLIDTYGKEINLSKNGISYVDENGELQQITYEKENLPANTLQNGSELGKKEINRFKVTNQENETTIYDSRPTEILTIMNRSSGGDIDEIMDPYGEDMTIDTACNIERIIEPSGSERQIQYQYIVPPKRYSPRSGAYAVSAVFDTDHGQIINRETYSLSSSGMSIIKLKHNEDTGAKTTYKYDSDGLCTTETTSANGTYSYDSVETNTSYDSEFNPTTSTFLNHGLRRSTNQTYNTEYPNSLSASNDGRVKVQYTYFAKNGKLTNIPSSVTYTKTGESAPLYSVQNTLTADEKAIEYSRVIENNLIKAQTKYEYDESGRVIREIRWIGDTNGDGALTESDETSETAYTYAEENGLHVITCTVSGIRDADGNAQPPSVTVYKSNLFGSPVSQTDPNGNTTTVEYDALQRPVKLTYASGVEETASYDMSVPSMTVTDKRGNVQKTVYTKTGEISGIYRQNGDSWIPLSLYTYDSACRPVSVKTYRDSGNFKTEEYTYDLYSRITQKQIKENTTLRSTESYTYSISGTTTKSTAGADGTAIADQIETVDAYGRLLSSQFKNGSETIASTYTYDCFDNCLTATDPMGTKTTNTYDIFGNLLTSQTPYSGTVSNTYDMAGRRQTATDRNGNTAVYHYDVLDRLILEETPFDEQNTAKKKYFYDSASNLISEKQQKNAPGEAESYRTVNYAYNNRNQITAVSGDTVPVSYTYDSAENRISQQIGTGEETAEYLYTYDTLGQVLSETNPLEKACTYTYDYAGNVLTKTDRNGNVTQNTYGIFGISKTQIGTSVTDYSYNGIGQLMQKKLTSSQKLTDEESYTYDPFGRMTACENQDCSITNPAVVDNGYQLQYSYDKNSNLLGYTLSENQTQKSVVSYQYDQNNRLTKATLDGKIFLYQYDQNGNLLQKQGGGITTQIAYNKANLPVSYQNGTLQSYAYTYALDGNRLTDSETVSQVQKSYQYTNRGELSAETVNGATTAYTYDSRGNRLTKTGNDTAAYLYDLANRMTKETHATWYEDNSYDHAGNLSNVYHFYQSQDNPDSYNMQFWWYQYNELNQLTSYHKNGDEWTYTYNVNGLRNSKQASHGDTATFTWNGGNMIREKDSVMENIYTYGVDGVAAQKNRLWDLVYQKNAHGDVVSITNINGDTTDSYTYDAFGNQPSSAADYYKNFRFCGEYTDPETGFVYLRNRYYNPSTGRFITEDPVQDGMNWYSYCGGNPVMRVDPFGLAPEDHQEFGEGAVTKKLDELGVMWTNSDSDIERSRLHEYAELIRGLERLRMKHGLQRYPLGYKYNTVSALETLSEYAPTVRRTSKLLGISDNMIYSVLFREMMCFKIDDYFDSAKATIRGDASLGLGQIFIHTAQEAERFQFGYVLHSQTDLKSMLMDNSTNIYYVGLVLIHAGNMVGIDITNGYNFGSIDKVFARYNGTNAKATQYGRETAQYFQVFSQHSGGLL